MRFEYTYKPDYYVLSNREFLTGFHKRKLERRAKAQEYAKQQAKKEHVQAVKEQREARQKETKERLEKLQSIIDKTYGVKKESGDEDGEKGEDTFDSSSEDITNDNFEEEIWNNRQKGNKKESNNNNSDSKLKSKDQSLSDMKEYRTRDTLTTVTIVEDFKISNVNDNDSNINSNNHKYSHHNRSNKHNGNNIQKSNKSNKKFRKRK
ncbi:4479_t:CDS:2 [Ambispora gerdemannii]|uniref:4479_t:CDS:1 n=1 Tax=Ambispora gerdemannii TaxID=144530 RepID=A0A9N9F8L6_9GLOM|nr:4479_t:CDS:2 [Ambispora gerdemannii]